MKKIIILTVVLLLAACGKNSCVLDIYPLSVGHDGSVATMSDLEKLTSQLGMKVFIEDGDFVLYRKAAEDIAGKYSGLKGARGIEVTIGLNRRNLNLRLHQSQVPVESEFVMQIRRELLEIYSKHFGLNGFTTKAYTRGKALGT